MSNSNHPNSRDYFDYIDNQIELINTKINIIMQVVQPDQRRQELPEILSVKLIAELMGYTTNNVHQKIINYGLPVIKHLGGARKETFFKWLADQETQYLELAEQRKKTKGMLS